VKFSELETYLCVLLFYVNYDISDGIRTKYTAGNFVCVFVLLAHDFIIFGEQQNRDSPFVRVNVVIKHCERESSYGVSCTASLGWQRRGRGVISLCKWSTVLGANTWHKLQQVGRGDPLYLWYNIKMK
jgi:hypothetical protein